MTMCRTRLIELLPCFGNSSVREEQKHWQRESIDVFARGIKGNSLTQADLMLSFFCPTRSGVTNMISEADEPSNSSQTM